MEIKDMDPYEYLLSKLDIMLAFPMGWTKERIFKFYRNLGPFEDNKHYHKELDRFCRLLSCFPAELESKEHVDLLLAVNGLNKAA